MNDLSKVIVITGAASGIGRSLSKILLTKGFKLVLTDVAENSLHILEDDLSSIKGPRLFMLADVSSFDDLKLVKEKAIQKFSKIDVWINNAGVMPIGNFADMDIQKLNSQIDVNFKGVIFGMQCILPYFEVLKKGHIINIASITAKVPLPYASVYSATKSAIFQLTEGVRVEYSGKGVLFSCIFPGAVNTPMTKDMKKTTFPPVIEPNKVCRAILSCIKKPKRRVFIPWYLGPLSSLQVILPQRLLEFTGKFLGVTESVKPK